MRTAAAPGGIAYACLLCGSENARTIRHQFSGRQATRLDRCLRCGLEYLCPTPSFETLKAIYTHDYFDAWGMASGECATVATMKTATFLPYLERLTRMTHAGAILDVGTGTGFFLQAAERYGFQPYGIKLSDYAAAIAATKFAADRIHRGTLEDAPFPEHFFSAVTMFDVLEHLRDPVGSLVIARRLLRSGGVLVIVTPNTASLTRRLMSTAWLHYKLEHLSYWNPRTMRHVAEMTGYSVHSLTSAKKALTLGYARTHLLAYPVPILTVLAGRLQVPRRIARRTLTMSIGEIAAYLRKR